jgi:hypothetical protein
MWQIVYVQAVLVFCTPNNIISIWHWLVINCEDKKFWLTFPAWMSIILWQLVGSGMGIPAAIVAFLCVVSHYTMIFRNVLSVLSETYCITRNYKTKHCRLKHRLWFWIPLGSLGWMFICVVPSCVKFCHWADYPFKRLYVPKVCICGAKFEWEQF